MKSIKCTFTHLVYSISRFSLNFWQEIPSIAVPAALANRLYLREICFVRLSYAVFPHVLYVFESSRVGLSCAPCYHLRFSSVTKGRVAIRGEARAPRQASRCLSMSPATFHWGCSAYFALRLSCSCGRFGDAMKTRTTTTTTLDPTMTATSASAGGPDAVAHAKTVGHGRTQAFRRRPPRVE